MSYLEYYFELNIETGEPMLFIVAKDGKCYEKPVTYTNPNNGLYQSILRPTLQTKSYHEARFCKTMNELYIAYKKGEESIVEKLAPLDGVMMAYKWDNQIQQYVCLGQAKYRGQTIHTSLKPLSKL